jgi:tetratricopeptide (TPR) repeat protein
LIDFNLEIKNVQPINIKAMELSRYRINDNIRKSIILYNKSIAEIKTNNLDLAVNDLKKALSYNKGFSEAIKLLGLCYVNQKKYRKAEKIFKKLAEYDIYNDLAKEYIKNLIIEKNVSKTMDAIRSVNSSSKNKKEKAILNKHSRGKLIISFSVLIFILAGAAITYWATSNHIFSFPQINTNKNANNKIVDSNEKANDNSEASNALAEKNTVSYDDYKDLQEKLSKTESELDNYKNRYDILTMLNEVERSYKSGEYEKAASTLITMKNLSFDNETKIRFDKLWQDIKTNALWTIYNQGSRLYKQGKYQEALPKLKIASELDPNLDLMPWILYQIGVCYKEADNNQEALLLFKKVKDNYPKSDYASYSVKMINQIENQKN